MPFRGTTLVMLLVALLFGGIAVFLARLWLVAHQQNTDVTVQKPVAMDMLTVVVAAQALDYGQPLEPQVLREVSWPRSAVPQGAFSTIDDLSKDGRRVVLQPISPDEPVLASKISGPGARASLSALVKEGLRAVTVRVNDATGVAGFVLPGDRVDILYTRGQGASIDVLLQNVRVLAINQIADEKKADPIDAKVVTLELSPLDAQKLSLAQTTGDLTLTLRAAGSLDLAPSKRVVADELGPGVSPYQPAPQPAAAAARPQPLSTTAQITIYRGMNRTSQTVPLEMRP